MHTCPPPKEALDSWLKPYPSTADGYGHLLLEQIEEVDQELIDSLRPYFESAHLDAREHFHAQISPSCGAPPSPLSQPHRKIGWNRRSSGAVPDL